MDIRTTVPGVCGLCMLISTLETGRISAGGMMEPIGTLYDKTGFVIMHRCTECGEERNVFGASNDNTELMTELSSTEHLMS